VKTLLAATLVLAALVAGGCSKAAFPETAKGGEMPHSIIDPYLKIQSALAEDSVEGVRQNAGELTTAAAALGAPAMKIDTTAAQLTSAGELDDARDKFGRLSEAIDAYMKGFNLKAPAGVRAAYCPMALKPWLQQGDTLANPYYGKSMPTCGEFR
jgi:Cu(I)/Ag(I) efflux system membrane fusion protein